MADKTLISGAAQVAATKGSGNLAAAQAGTQVGAFLADNLGKMIQKRNNEFNKLMEAELEAAGELSHEDAQKLIKRLKGKRAGYVLLNKRGMVAAEKELLEDGKKIKDKKDTKIKVVEKIIDDCEDKTPCDCLEQEITETEDGWEIDPRTKWALENAPDEVMYTPEGKPYILSYDQAWNNVDKEGNELEDPRFTESADGKTKTSIHGHVYPNTPEGQAIYRAHAESNWQAEGGQALDFTDPETLKETWYKSATYQDLKDKDIKVVESWAQGNEKVNMTNMEYEGLVNYLAVDKESQTKISTVVQAVTEDANAFVGGDTTKTFNYDATKNNIMTNVINADGVNLRSLAKDSIWGGTSWETDMQEALTNGTYQDLGITQEQAENLDPNGGNITAEDAKVITQAIMKDDALLKETLGDYYTKIAENNYNLQSKKPNADLNQGGGDTGDTGGSGDVNLEEFE